MKQNVGQWINVWKLERPFLYKQNYHTIIY